MVAGDGSATLRRNLECAHRDLENVRFDVDFCRELAAQLKGKDSHERQALDASASLLLGASTIVQHALDCPEGRTPGIGAPMRQDVVRVPTWLTATVLVVIGGLLTWACCMHFVGVHHGR